MIIKLSKGIFLLMFFIILFTIFQTRIYYRGEEKTCVLQDAFFSTGAEFVNSEVYVWADIDEHNNSTENLLNLAEKFVVDLSVVENNDFSKQTTNSNFIDETEIKGCCADGKIVCITTRLSKNSEHRSNISINVINEMIQKDIIDSANLLEEKFRKYSLKPKVNTCIIGCFDGKLDNEEMDSISKIILNKAKAKKISVMSDNNLISISAYSPRIDNNIEIQGKKMNINLALRYNAYEDKTYIWLATPVITIEY